MRFSLLFQGFFRGSAERDILAFSRASLLFLPPFAKKKAGLEGQGKPPQNVEKIARFPNSVTSPPVMVVSVPIFPGAKVDVKALGVRMWLAPRKGGRNSQG